MLIECFYCNGDGCTKCVSGTLLIPDLHDVSEALSNKDTDKLAHIYIQSLRWLNDIENEYNQRLLKQLDFESRTAIDKQEKAILQSSPELQKFPHAISSLKANIRACNFALECIKLCRTKEGVT